MDLVTGGTGIVGAHLLLELLRAGRPVRALHRPSTDRVIVRSIFRHYGHEALFERIEWAEGDILDVVALADAMTGAERVFHAAAQVTFDPRRAQELYAVNTRGTAHVVDAALEAGVRRLVHVSSTSAIGKGAPGSIRHEGLAWTDAKDISHYSRSKHLAEMEVARGVAEGLDAVIVNPGVIIGPGLAGRSSMMLMERLRRGTRWYPTGTNAFVDARDVAACMVGLMERGLTGERYLLVGANAGYRELFDLVSRAMGQPLPDRRLRPWMLELAWRAERLRTLVTGGSPLVTRTTAATSMGQRAYSAAKVEALLGHRFRSLEEAVSNTVSFAGAG